MLAACSILEDSDISSSDDLAKLKLKSIQIVHAINGSSTHQEASAVDEAVDISSAVGHITRRMIISWPDLGSQPKFKFRSELTSNIQIRFLIGADGKIRYGYVDSGDITYEVYRFEYDAQGRLLKLGISISQNGVDFVSTLDTFDPPGGYFAYRSSADPTKRALLGGDFQFTNNCFIKMPYQYDWNNGGDYDSYKQYNYCGKDNFSIDPGGQSADFYVTGDILIEEVFIGSRSTSSDPACCLDTYYFHPLLFLPVDISLRIMYSTDWWEEKNEFGGKQNESVKMKFKYGF